MCHNTKLLKSLSFKIEDPRYAYQTNGYVQSSQTQLSFVFNKATCFDF
jgi:hypothetical protein